MEIDRPVQLQHQQPRRSCDQVDADEVAVDSSGGGDGQSDGGRLRHQRLSGAAEAEVGAPVAWSWPAPDRADHTLAGDHDTRVGVIRREWHPAAVASSRNVRG